MQLQKAIEELEKAKSDNNARRDLAWYQRWARLLKNTDMPDLVALQVWMMMDDVRAFKYEHVAISALQSLALAIKDREDGLL